MPADARPVDLPAIFDRIERLIRPALDPLRAASSSEADNFLWESYHRLPRPSIDYDHYAGTFALNYFLVNFRKAGAAFLSSPTLLPRNLVDVGCGSGAATLAYMAVLEQSLGDALLQLPVHLVDRSPTQLDLARRILEAARPELPSLSFKIRPTVADIASWSPEDGGTDAVLFSYVLNENRHAVPSILDKAAASLSPNGHVVILESRTDPIWEDIEEFLADLAMPSGGGIVHPSSATGIPAEVRDPRPWRFITARYLTFDRPGTARLVELVRLYFRAWRTRSVSLIEEIFAPDAEYREKPGLIHYCGIDSIRRYWRENVLVQTDLTLRAGRVAYGPTYAFCEFQADFRKHGQRMIVRGFLTLHLDPSGRKVAALDEHYRTETPEG